jgi:hypothetical protein
MIDAYMLRRAKLMADLINNPVSVTEVDKIRRLSRRYKLREHTVFRAVLLSKYSTVAVTEYLLRKNWQRAVNKID